MTRRATIVLGGLSAVACLSLLRGRPSNVAIYLDEDPGQQFEKSLRGPLAEMRHPSDGRYFSSSALGRASLAGLFASSGHGDIGTWRIADGTNGHPDVRLRIGATYASFPAALIVPVKFDVDDQEVKICACRVFADTPGENLDQSVTGRGALACGFASEIRCDSLRGDWERELVPLVGKAIAFAAAIAAGNEFPGDPVCVARPRDRSRLVTTRLQWDEWAPPVIVEPSAPVPGDRAWSGVAKGRVLVGLDVAAVVEVQQALWSGVPSERGDFRLVVKGPNGQVIKTFEDGGARPRAVDRWNQLFRDGSSVSIVPAAEAREIARRRMPDGSEIQRFSLMWSEDGQRTLDSVEGQRISVGTLVYVAAFRVRLRGLWTTGRVAVRALRTPL